MIHSPEAQRILRVQIDILYLGGAKIYGPIIRGPDDYPLGNPYLKD